MAEMKIAVRRRLLLFLCQSLGAAATKAVARQPQRWNQNGFRCCFSPAISFIDTASKMRPPTIT